MHEMSIALHIKDIVIDSIPGDQEGARVDAINLKIGKLTAVVPKSLRFCFNIISRDTPFKGAILNIEEPPLILFCNDCNKESTIIKPPFICQNCKSSNIEFLSGRELLVASIEVSQP